MPWHGPFQVRVLLETAIDDGREIPPEDGGIYAVSIEAWQGCPSQDAKILYVGGNTGVSKRFRTRIGDLIADMCGFFGDETNHHSGGQSLWRWCHEHKVKPLDLFIGWESGIRCKRCAENEAYDSLRPLLNKKRPSKCAEHG